MVATASSSCQVFYFVKAQLSATGPKLGLDGLRFCLGAMAKGFVQVWVVAKSANSQLNPLVSI